jgi:hypothetical protein
LFSNGEITALRNAIQKANDGPEDRLTTIKVSGDFNFTANDSMPPIDAAFISEHESEVATVRTYRSSKHKYNQVTKPSIHGSNLYDV